MEIRRFYEDDVVEEALAENIRRPYTFIKINLKRVDFCTTIVPHIPHKPL